ncbi:hypothetical protein M9980_10390 [Sphingomonas donggukensis]|uniref:Flippase-like domain-containing protein n=1 Tax=Sphingomonas donggukensis TaxID=2949093 RepID=A0ABY4TXD6_9SPHN|nr:hypothetical protein [Sphingomonas donggukensis]URW74968.1 hypothetical protein M9980_10390 [Sphingomonas donggukensis]
MKPPEVAAATVHGIDPGPTLVPSVLPDGEIDALEPVERIKRRWPQVLAGGLTLLMVAFLARELFGEGLEALSRTVPESPAFYVAFALLYMSPPTFDWIIFRRLWRIPGEGLIALMKKRVANEVVFGYSGEAYFYAWARARMKMVTAPFGAVKDNSILSAIAGNAITLIMLLVAFPFAKDLLTDGQFKMVAGSAAVTIATSVPFLIFSRRVFSLPKPTLWWVFWVHCARLIFGSTMIALAWHFAMPDVSIGMWLFLSAGRLLVSRLPLVPNKDLLFANFAILLIGQGDALSDLVAFTAALTLLAHVVFIAGVGLYELVKRKTA